MSRVLNTHEPGVALQKSEGSESINFFQQLLHSTELGSRAWLVTSGSKDKTPGLNSSRKRRARSMTPGQRFSGKHRVTNRAVIPKGNRASFGFASEKLEPSKNSGWVWGRTVVATWLWLYHYGRQFTVALGEKKGWVCRCNRDKDAVWGGSREPRLCLWVDENLDRAPAQAVATQWHTR